jgi:hypothetical protein
MSFKFITSCLRGKTMLHWVMWSSKFFVYTDSSWIHHIGLKFLYRFSKIVSNLLQFQIFTSEGHYYLHPYIYIFIHSISVSSLLKNLLTAVWFLQYLWIIYTFLLETLYNGHTASALLCHQDKCYWKHK